MILSVPELPERDSEASKSSKMWQAPFSWEQRLQDPSENISICGEAGIADNRYFANMLHVTNVGSEQLSGLIMQWESSHKKAVKLLRDELRRLSVKRQEAESKRRKILEEDTFNPVNACSRAIHFSETPVPPEETPVVSGSPPDKYPDVGHVRSIADTIHTRNTEEQWRAKVENLSQLLTESLNREQVLLDKLEKDSESVTPVSELKPQLERIDNFLHFVLRNAPVILCHQDQELRYRFVYNQYPRFQSEMIGKTDLELIKGVNAHETYNFKKEVLKRGRPAKREFIYEEEYGTKAFLICAEPVFSKEGEPLGINVFCVETTDQVANREKLIRLREEAAVQSAMETQLHKTMQITEETMKAKQLLATMSHEIRSPLSGVVSIAEILATTNLDTEQMHMVETMMSSGELVMQLINDILDLSKVESGAMKLEATKFRPREVIKNVLQIAAASSQKHTLTLEGTISHDVPFEVIGDVLRVRQILTNLVSNAMKFTREGSVHVKLEVLQQVNNDTVLLECRVIDTGIGIPETALPFLFKKYMQVSETHARKYGGTGLGLAICKQLVELMDGKLNVTSQENKGSTFSFTLPCKICECSVFQDTTSGSFRFTPRCKRSNTVDQGDSAKVNGKVNGQCSTVVNCQTVEKIPEENIPRILLVEDTKLQVLVAQKMLKMLGLSATVVNNGLEALEAVRKENFDLILMDVCMPKMDGLEATRLIRQLQSNRSCRSKIVAMTANVLPEDIEKCYAHGMDSFVSKPLNFQNLQRVIKQLVPQN